MSSPFDAAPSWQDRFAPLTAIASMPMFLIGGAPRSGTTWLGQMLDTHPDINCRGEGLFGQNLAASLDTLMAERRKAVAAKNESLFRHTGGYPLPEAEDADLLLGAGVLRAFAQQLALKPAKVVGEKTPENLFLYPRFRKLFPHTKLICIAREPRDVVASAWHLFQKDARGESDQAKIDFIRSILPALVKGTRAMLILEEKLPDSCRIVTYEALHAEGEAALLDLFRFLGVAAAPDIAARCVAENGFAAVKARAGGSAFLRAGRAGGWRETLTPEMGAMITGALGSVYPRFGWG